MAWSEGRPSSDESWDNHYISAGLCCVMSGEAVVVNRDGDDNGDGVHFGDGWASSNAVHYVYVYYVSFNATNRKKITEHSC